MRTEILKDGWAIVTEGKDRIFYTINRMDENGVTYCAMVWVDKIKAEEDETWLK